MNFKADSFRERVAQNQMRFKIVLSDLQNEEQLNLKWMIELMTLSAWQL